MLFIKANNLSGAFIWSLDLDDFDGKYCNQGKFPLLSQMKSELESSDTINYDVGNGNDENGGGDLQFKQIESVSATSIAFSLKSNYYSTLIIISFVSCLVRSHF